MPSPEVTVIIPTLCCAKRSEELVRAIRSVTEQQGVEIIVLVVVNGSLFDPELLGKVSDTKGVKVLSLEVAGISNARFRGRQYVDTPYFLFLDDDDELYPFALHDLLGKFSLSESDVGLVIADAYNDYRSKNYGFYPSCSEIELHPLAALLDENWLIVQSTLFKTEVVPSRIFDIKTNSNECTMIAFNIALENIKIKVLDKVICVIHDKEDSESKTEHFITNEPYVIKWMLTKDVPREIKIKLHRKLAAAFHNNSMYYLKRNVFLAAFVNHVKSMLISAGDSYFLYGRHILNKFISRLF